VADVGKFISIGDRKKELITTGGVNVYPGEVEEGLIRHQAGRDVAVVGLPSDEWGEAVTAVLVTAPGVAVPDDELDALCRRELSRHKVPRRYVATDEVPRNAAGKILKRQLREQLLAGPASPGAMSTPAPS